MVTGTVQDRTELFQIAGGNEGQTNFKGAGGSLPSDQSMVVLALRVFLWFRNPIARGAAVVVAGGTNYFTNNGDFAYAGVGNTWSAAQSLVANGNQAASTQDIHRLYWQASEQLLWTFGAGEKPSLNSMPSSYMPYGGGLHGDLGNATDLIHWDNGMPDHTGILRLARAILIPPRQNVRCSAQIVALPDGGNNPLFGGVQGGARNMLSLRDNLNAPDLASKCVSFTFDGLFSRDVQ